MLWAFVLLSSVLIISSSSSSPATDGKPSENPIAVSPVALGVRLSRSSGKILSPLREVKVESEPASELSSSSLWEESTHWHSRTTRFTVRANMHGNNQLSILGSPFPSANRNENQSVITGIRDKLIWVFELCDSVCQISNNYSEDQSWDICMRYYDNLI